MLIDLLYDSVQQPAFVIHGVRKIVQGLHHTHVGPLPAKDILSELGYRPMKITRLMNLYYNAADVEKAKAKLAERRGEEHSSVSILTRNMEKTHPQAQGWCIQNITISESWQRKQRIVTADIFYRSTELIQKFGADLSLINRVYEAMEIEPHVTRFYFANAYVSAVFFPIMFRYTDGVKFLRHIGKHDADFHALACKAVSRYLDPVNRYTYKTQEKQWGEAQKLDRVPLDEYLMKVFPEYHEPHLPKRGRK